MTELSQLSPRSAELPESPVAGLEPLLTLEQLREWTGFGLTHVNSYRRRAQDPLPTVGTVRSPRFVPSEVLAWMRREYARTNKAA